MTTIFISYRRNDDPYAARGINDALVKQFGNEKVYFDLDALLAGLDWREQIDKMVAECDVMLVVIGDRWLEADESGRFRLEDADDLVRVEVSSALKRNIPVIPVLVGNADIPDEDVLPEDLKPLHYRQYAEVRATSNFIAQIDSLLRNIRSVAGDRSMRFKPTMRAAVIFVPVIAAISIGLIMLSFVETDSDGELDPSASIESLHEGGESGSQLEESSILATAPALDSLQKDLQENNRERASELYRDLMGLDDQGVSINAIKRVWSGMFDSTVYVGNRRIRDDYLDFMMDSINSGYLTNEQEVMSYYVMLSSMAMVGEDAFFDSNMRSYEKSANEYRKSGGSMKDIVKVNFSPETFVLYVKAESRLNRIEDGEFERRIKKLDDIWNAVP